MTNWYYSKNGSKHGPVSGAELKALAANGTLTPDDKVWREGLKEWKIAGKVIGLFPTGKSEGTGSSPPPLPEEGNPASNNTGATKAKTDKSAPPASLDDATPFDELFNSAQQAGFSQPPESRQTSTSQGVERFSALLSRFDANQFTWGYRIALAIGILGVFLPWYSVSSAFNSHIVTGSSSMSVSGILTIWGVLALLAGVGGELTSFIKPKLLTQLGCAISMSIFCIIAILQFNALSPMGVDVHSSFGGFSAFGSLSSGIGVGAWLTLLSGLVASILSFFERSTTVRRLRMKVPTPGPRAQSNSRNDQKQPSPTSEATDLDIGYQYRLYKSEKTSLAWKLLALAIIGGIVVASTILVNKLFPGVIGKSLSSLTGAVTADAYIQPILLDQMGAFTIADALVKASKENPKSTTIVVKLWLRSQNRATPNLIYSHTFNAVAVESARKSGNGGAFLMDADEHGVSYETTLNNAIKAISRGW